VLAILLCITQSTFAVVGQVLSYDLTVNSSPIIGVEFHIDGQAYSTPWSGFLPQGNHTVAVPTSWVHQGTTYRFASWEDGSTDPSRLVNLNRDVTIEARYELLTHTLAVETIPQGIEFTLDGTSHTSPWSDALPEGNHTVAMPSTVVLNGWVYIFSVWEEDSSTNPQKTLSLTGDLTIHATFRLEQVVDVTGDQIVRVILVEFHDVLHSVKDDAIRTRLSLVQAYFQETSYGVLRLRFDLVQVWLTLDKSMTFYGAGDFTSEKHEELATDSIQAASQHTDFAISKRVLIVHSGGDQASSPHDQDDIWSFALPPIDYSTSAGEVRLFAAAVSESDPPGMIAHEVGHMLGLPDLYNVTINANGGEDSFVGPWDLMAQGSWNSDWMGENPSYLSSWSMMYLGWMPSHQVVLVELKQTRTVTIDPLEVPSSGLHTVVLPLGSQEFYIIEARADPYLPQQGVLVYYVNNVTLRILVQDATPSTRTLSDAAYQLDSSRIPAFVDPQQDLAVTVLDNERNQYRLLIGPATTGYNAITTAKSVYSLITRLQDAENRTGLSLNRTKAELDKAIELYSFAAFDQAMVEVRIGDEVLDEELKLSAQQSIAKAEAELNEASSHTVLWISPDLSQPNEVLRRAKGKYTEGDFVQAFEIITKEFEPAIHRANIEQQRSVEQLALIEFVVVIIESILVAVLVIRWRSD